MLPATHRLKKDAEFARVFETGDKKLFGPLLIFTAGGETDLPRFGVVVSKKVSKKAVERNKVRRQVTELLRARLAANASWSARDVVLVILRLATYQQLEKALEQWQKKQLSA